MPVNEFGDNDFALCGSFPHVFLFGTAYGNNHSYSLKQTRHLLLQFTGIPAESRELIFLLFDQQQRHSVVKGIWTQVSGKAGRQSFDKLVKLFQTAEFQQLLEDANKDTESKAARKLLDLTLTTRARHNLD